MSFARRVAWDLRPNALSTLLSHKRRTGARILDLTESNPTRAGLPYPAREILAALAPPEVLRYEPAARGPPVARAAVAGYYRSRGCAVDPERVLLTASTSEGYAHVFKLLCDPGERVLVPAPSYPLFEFLGRLEGVHVDPYPLAYHDGWEIDLAGLAEAVRPSTRAVLVVSPNNPTGSYLKERELAALRALCARHGMALVADEVFADYPLSPADGRVETLAAEGDVLTFTLSGLSKVVGLPQVKLGWMVASGPGAEAALERLEVIADTYLSVSTMAQLAVGPLLEAGAPVREAIRARTAANLEALRRALGPGSPCTLLRVEGGWYATLRLPGTRPEEAQVLMLLSEHDVLVHPGHFFDFPAEAYAVLSLLAEPEVFEEGVARLVGAVLA
jgi:alanine-synthesizing transaminase